MSAVGAGMGDGSLLLLAQDYHPVEDADYIDCPSVGAMMGSKAIRKALQRSYQSRTAALHVHMHEHLGRPGFSGTDIRENAKFEIGRATSELQSLMRISYAVFCLKKKKHHTPAHNQ